jgi:hypothetical protein
MVVVGAQLSFYPPMLLRRRTGSACKLRFRRKAGAKWERFTLARRSFASVAKTQQRTIRRRDSRTLTI